MGKNMLRLLKFAITYQVGWHTYGKDTATVDALRRLENLGLIVRNQVTRQFRLAGEDRYKTGYDTGYEAGCQAKMCGDA